MQDRQAAVAALGGLFEYAAASSHKGQASGYGSCYFGVVKDNIGYPCFDLCGAVYQRESCHCQNLEDEDHLQNIVRYVDIAISMYSRAIPHRSLDKVILMFTKNWTDGTEPYIYMEFDSTSLTAAIDDLWCSDVKLNRSMEQECVNLSGLVWDEYRASVDNEQLRQDAEKICNALQKKYSSTNVGFLIKEIL